jgi:hypothetical protein
VVELHSNDIPVSVLSNFNIIMDQLSSGNANLVSVLTWKCWRLHRENVVLLITEDFIPCITLQRYKNLWWPTRVGLILHMKHSNKCETVARIQVTQVGKVWNNVTDEGVQCCRPYFRYLLYLVM